MGEEESGEGQKGGRDEVQEDKKRGMGLEVRGREYRAGKGQRG